MEGILPYKLRHVAEHYLLVPIEDTGIPSYCFLNRTSAEIFDLMAEGRTHDEIIEYFLNTFPEIQNDKLRHDISTGYNELKNIISSKRIRENYNASKENSLRHSATTLGIPIDGSIELTFKCNLNCHHCYCVHCEWPKPNLTTQQWIECINDIAKNGCVWLLITGGEPLLRTDFETIFLHAKQCGMIITVFSNGLAITEEHCRLFKEMPPHLLEISVYGLSDDTYKLVTGGKNGFTKLVQSLDLLDKHGVKYSLKTTVTSGNADELFQIQEFAKKRGSFFRHDSNIINRIDGMDVPQGIALPPAASVDAEFIGDVELTIDAWKKTKDERTMYFKDKLFFCNAGKISFNIDPFGNVSACGRVRTPSTSILHTDFATAWSNLRKFTQQPSPDNFKCRSCEGIEYCKPCPASAVLSAEQLNQQCQSSKRRAEIIQSNGLALEADIS